MPTVMCARPMSRSWNTCPPAISRRDAMLYFPLVPHHGWHRSIPANDFRYQDFRVPDWREWAGKLDEGNIELTVLYPTRFMHIGQIGNPRYAVELCRAYVLLFHEQFLIRDRRFRGMALLPLPGRPVGGKRTAPSGKKPWHGRRYLAQRGCRPFPRSHIVSPDFHRSRPPGLRPLGPLPCTLLRDNDRFRRPNEVATLAHVIPWMPVHEHYLLWRDEQTKNFVSAFPRRAAVGCHF